MTLADVCSDFAHGYETEKNAGAAAGRTAQRPRLVVQGLSHTSWE